VKVKICGITNTDDALSAADLGADALGFIFVKSSPRYIPPRAAQKIIQELPPFVVPVGVVADMEYNEILEIIGQTGIGCVQLHGEEVAKQVHHYPVPVIQSFRIDSLFDPEILRQYQRPAYLLDAKVSGKLGGTGQTFDWEIAVKAKQYGRIILAGGLNPENIREAARRVQPYAVDVNSGVEERPGKKDYTKLKLLFEQLKQMKNV
jgi:phosphoribosylanthranilate isomerase